MAETLRGGGSIGPYRYMGYRCSWPLASLTVERDALTYRIFPLTYRFEKRDIQCLVEERGLFARRLRIVHRRTEYPRCFLFYNADFPRLHAELERHGHLIRPEGDGQAAPDPSLRYSNAVTLFTAAAAALGLLAALAAIFWLPRLPR